MTAQATQFERDKLAKWYANQHLKADHGISEILYLPQNCAQREIRFIEVNKSLGDDRLPHELIPIDFGVDMGQESEHRLWVLDVSPTQYKQIQTGEVPLPEGWVIAGSQNFTR